MQPRVVVLGADPIGIDPSVPREASEGPEPLLAEAPDAAIVAATGDAAFFRASLALERGVRRVVLRRGVLPDAWLEELAARAIELGGEVFVRGDDDRFQRVARGARVRQRLEVGAPPAASFDAFVDPTGRGASMPSLELSAAERALRCEEVAFEIGLKPVLYLVVARDDVERVVARHPGVRVAQREDRLSASACSGERTYGVGDEVAHLFLGERAERAAELWADSSTKHVEELGALMGYPACCVRAFRAMASRRVNAAFPYVTASRTRALGARFDALLDVTSARLVPFVPCSYGCRAAIAWARRVAEAASIERAARVVLFVDEARAIAFDEASVEERADGTHVTYRGPRWASPALDDRSERLREAYGPIFSDRGTLVVRPDALVVEGTRVERAGGLGVVLPFG